MLKLCLHAHSEFYFSRKSAMNEEEIVAKLAPALQRSVQQHLISRTVLKLPLFCNERPYANLEMQLRIHTMLKPLLREPREEVVESLEKGAAAGVSIYFVRRGTLAAHGDMAGLNFYEIDASSETGALIGEHSLMLHTRCLCRYRAVTRCEIYSLAVSDFGSITSDLTHEQKNEMAELVYQSHIRRLHARAVMTRIYKKAATQQGLDRTLAPVLTLQTQFFRRVAFKAAAARRAYAADMSILLPGVYVQDFFANDRLAQEAGCGGSNLEQLTSQPAHTTRNQRVSRESNVTINVAARLESLQASLEHLEQRIEQLPTTEGLRAIIEQAAQKAAEQAVGVALAEERQPQLVSLPEAS